MAEVRWTPQAAEGLESIAEFIAEDSPQNARLFVYFLPFLSFIGAFMASCNIDSPFSCNTNLYKNLPRN
jgi:hypothetical protein